MSRTRPAPDPAERRERIPFAAIALLIVALAGAVAAYAPGLSSPYVFDDERYVRDNPALVHAWPAGWLRAGTQETRPVTNLSFALDASLFGPTARVHHLVNLGLHLLGAVLLFGLARTVLRALRPRVSDPDLVAALAAALLALHPVQSGTVL